MTTRTEKFPRPPDKRENARWSRAGAEVGSRGKLNTTSCIPSGPKAQPLAGPRFERQIARVHALGPRPLAELLAEIAAVTGQPAIVADRLQTYARLDPEIVRAVGGDRFPPMLLGLVR